MENLRLVDSDGLLHEPRKANTRLRWLSAALVENQASPSPSIIAGMIIGSSAHFRIVDSDGHVTILSITQLTEPTFLRYSISAELSTEENILVLHVLNVIFL